MGCLLLLWLVGCGNDDRKTASDEGMGSFEGHVADLATFLKPDEVAQLEEQLDRYQEQTGVHFLLYTAESGVLEAMSKRLERRVDLNAQGLNASAFILIARRERQIKIEVNHGLEWQIPDSVSNPILDQLIQNFQQERYLKGLQAAFGQMHDRVKHLPFEVRYQGLAEVQEENELAIGQIVAFEGRYQGQPPTQPGPGQFDPVMHLLIKGQNGAVTRVYFSRYMQEMVRSLARPDEPSRLRARIRELAPQIELELMALD